MTLRVRPSEHNAVLPAGEMFGQRHPPLYWPLLLSCCSAPWPKVKHYEWPSTIIDHFKLRWFASKRRSVKCFDAQRSDDSAVVFQLVHACRVLHCQIVSKMSTLPPGTKPDRELRAGKNGEECVKPGPRSEIQQHVDALFSNRLQGSKRIENRKLD